jgi:hypothetical protein
MNEQIKTIWDNCVRNYGHAGQEVCAKMFAESIIKECIVKYDEWAEESFDQTSFRMARHNVKKHFGVDT